MAEILLWIPCGSNRPESWLQVSGYMHTKVPEGYSLNFKLTPPGDTMRTWNDLTRGFLESGAEWLWSVHDDVVYHPLTLERLLSWNEPTIGALIFTKQNPALPHIWKIHNERHAQMADETRDWFMERKDNILPGPQVIHPRPEDALTPVSFTSTSCCLIHRKVLEDTAKYGDWWEQDTLYEAGGEDRRFFTRVRQEGYTPYVDRSCIVGHLGVHPTGVMDFILWQNHPLFTQTCEDMI